MSDIVDYFFYRPSTANIFSLMGVVVFIAPSHRSDSKASIRKFASYVPFDLFWCKIRFLAAIRICKVTECQKSNLNVKRNKLKMTHSIHWVRCTTVCLFHSSRLISCRNNEDLNSLTCS